MDFSDFIKKLIKVTNSKKISFANSKNHDGNIIKDNYTKCSILNVEIFYSDYFQDVTIKSKDGLKMPFNKYIKRCNLKQHVCIPEEFLHTIRETLKRFDLQTKPPIGRMLGIFVLLIPHAIALLATVAAIGSAYVITNVVKNANEKNPLSEYNIDTNKLYEYLKTNENQNKIKKIQLIFYPVINYIQNKNPSDDRSDEIEYFNQNIPNDGAEIVEGVFQRPQDSSTAVENNNDYIRDYFNHRRDERLRLEENKEEIEDEEEKKGDPPAQERQYNFDEVDNRLFGDEDVDIDHVNPYQENQRNPFVNAGDNNSFPRQIEDYYNKTKDALAAAGKIIARNPTIVDMKDIIKKTIKDEKKLNPIIIDPDNSSKYDEYIDEITNGWFIYSNTIVDLPFDFNIRNNAPKILDIKRESIQNLIDVRKNKKKFRAVIYSKTIDF